MEDAQVGDIYIIYIYQVHTLKYIIYFEVPGIVYN